MKLSLEWLREYVELPESVTSEQIMHDLTMSTVEVEGLEDLGATFTDMFVGRVRELKPHPNADRLTIAVTDLGEAHGIKEIVCGGSNLSEGMAVAVAVPGAWVNWHGHTERTQLKLAKIRDVESFGMICSSSEIGLSTLYPAESEKEIIDLEDGDAVAGQPLAEYLGYTDVILDIDNKSLTNRPDLWGHYGIARELAAIYKCPLKGLPTFAFEDIATEGPVSVQIHNQELCQRFTAILVEGVTNGESPLWMRSRLARVGQRPISFLVDITNYVMFAVGKPTHAFDTLKVANGEIHVRDAQDKEKLTLLDDSELELTSDTLIVADNERALGLAGVMGGGGSGVTEQTNSIILESANFHATYIRKAAKQYDLRTESSMRFEKGLDTESTLKSQAYLLTILKELQPDCEILQFVDTFPVKPLSVHVSVAEPFIESRLGMKVPASEIETLLRSLGYGVVYRSANFSISVPAWRATGDVSLPEDIVEEVARLIGYDNLEFEPIPIKLEKAVRQVNYELDQGLRSYLAQDASLQEVVTYPWVEQKFIDACQATDTEAYELSAPPSPEQARLKTCLVPSLLELVDRNLRFFDDFGLFEISRVFSSKDNFLSTLKDEKLPAQPKILGAALVGKESQETFLRAKGVIEGARKRFGLEFDFRVPERSPAWAAASATLEMLTTDGELLGYIGLASRRTMRKAGIERVSVAFAVLNLDRLYSLNRAQVKFKPIPKFPEIEYDLAVVFDRQVPWVSISQTVLSSHDLIKDVLFVDEYTGKQIPEDKKSVAFKMILADEKETLTSEQAEVAATSVLDNLKSSLAGELRA